MKFFAVGLVVISLFVVSSLSTEAALVKVDHNGEVSWSVLAVETEDQETESLKVTKVATDLKTIGNSIVSLIKQEGKIELHVTTGEEKKTADVSDYEEELVEIEEKESVKKLSIISKDGNFLIKQQDILAATSFPITIDAVKKEIHVETPSGKRLIKVLPKEALDDMTQAHLIDTLPDGSMELLEDAAGELQYSLDGEKKLNLLNLVNLQAPVKLLVSATSGEVLSIEQPTWLRVLGFLFS